MNCPLPMIMSKWAFYFHLKDGGVYYNSLLRKVVFVSDAEYDLVLRYLHQGDQNLIPATLLNELVDAKILVSSSDDDTTLQKRIESELPSPYIGIMQLVVASSCNLACKYCFVGNSDITSNHSPAVTTTIMETNTALQALRFFSTQTLKKKEFFNSHKEIVFYGGEPLLNMPVIEATIQEAKNMQKAGQLPLDLSFSMVTNGTLLTPPTAHKLKTLGVNIAISLDGVNANANKYRRERSGDEAFSKILSGISVAQKEGLPFGLSITITKATLEQQDALIQFMCDNCIREASFNILIGVNDTAYFKKAATFIINFYKKTKGFGFFEDCMLRKINAISSKHFYFYDCAALAGNQIVVFPNGDIGICQGEISTGEFNVGKVFDTSLDVAEAPLVKEWNLNTPIFKNTCLNCYAIGICGGGCPVNARKLSKSHSLYALDERFCIHTKETLLFLLQELHALSVNNNDNQDR